MLLPPKTITIGVRVFEEGILEGQDTVSNHQPKTKWWWWCTNGLCLIKRRKSYPGWRRKWMWKNNATNVLIFTFNKRTQLEQKRRRKSKALARNTFGWRCGMCVCVCVFCMTLIRHPYVGGFWNGWCNERKGRSCHTVNQFWWAIVMEETGASINTRTLHYRSVWAIGSCRLATFLIRIRL